MKNVTLGLVTLVVLASLAVTASAAPAHHIVFGGGTYVLLPSTPEFTGTMIFSALQIGPGNNARGYFINTDRYIGQPRQNWGGNILYLKTEGKNAAMAGVITHSTLTEGCRAGQGFILFVKEGCPDQVGYGCTNTLEGAIHEVDIGRNPPYLTLTRGNVRVV